MDASNNHKNITTERTENTEKKRKRFIINRQYFSLNKVSF